MRFVIAWVRYLRNLVPDLRLLLFEEDIHLLHDLLLIKLDVVRVTLVQGLHAVCRHLLVGHLLSY